MLFRLRKKYAYLLLVGFLSCTIVSSLTVLPVIAASKSSSAAVKKAKTKAKFKAKSKSRVAKCSPNYSGCVPVGSDVDCKPGKGNGPKFTTGPKKVLKKDIYKLDNDRDGIACEKN